MVEPYKPCSEWLFPGVTFEGRSQPSLYLLLPKRTKWEPHHLRRAAVSIKYFFEDTDQAKETALYARDLKTNKWGLCSHWTHSILNATVLFKFILYNHKTLLQIISKVKNSCHPYKLSHFHFSIFLSSKIFLGTTSNAYNIPFPIVFSCLIKSRQEIKLVCVRV